MAPQRFASSYVRAMAAAALAFAVTHSAELFIIGLLAQRSWKIDPTGFVTLGFFVATEWGVFLALGTPIAYWPSHEMYRLSKRRGTDTYSYCILASLVVAAMALPLCAFVSFNIFPDSDGPSYLSRCFEYLLPMAVAGALGGHVFWRCIGHVVAGASAADHFS